ncbi:MAG: hypothetical protein FJ104_11435 [Deltaproteobacteria bacterium]|nr:hypothetical protein [Deltaproteobacteria bacterium]
MTASTGERFCIDSTYVSVAMYSEYLSAVESGTADRNGGPLWGEPDACVGNTLLVSENCGNWGLDDLERPDRIRSCVAPCDARSYCAWAGKRLCGLLPSATGAICTPPPTSDALATYLRQPLEFPASELLAACQSVFGEHQRLVEEKGCDASRARARSSGESECGFVGPLFDVIGGYEGTVAGGCESVSQDQNSGGQPATTVPAVVYQGILSGAPRCISNGVAGLIDDVNGITAIRCCADAPGGQP